jgi:hypothetical protein
MRMRAAALAFALVLPFAADAQQSPDLRPRCVDWAAVGSLDSVGYRHIDNPDDILGHGWFDYRMRVTRPVWQAKRDRDVPVSMYGHAQRIIYPPTLVFRSKSADGQWQYVGMARVFTGRNGSFIAIRGPLYLTDRDWRPDGFERFVRPIHIVEDYGHNPFGPEDAEPGYSEVRGGQRILLKGIFLRDLPALLATIPADACRR